MYFKNKTNIQYYYVNIENKNIRIYFLKIVLINTINGASIFFYKLLGKSWISKGETPNWWC